jgi:hypothetical protein
VHHLFARMNSREVVESEAERLRETKPALGTLTILLPQEAAKLIGVKSTLLSSWRVADDGPPYFKVGGSVRYDLDTVLKFVESRRLMLERMAGEADTRSRRRRHRKSLGENRA